MSDFTALESALTGLEAASTAAVAEINALKSGSDQASIDAATARIQAVAASLNAAAPPATGSTGALTVNPASISSPAGSAISQTLTPSGGDPPYTFTSSLADVTVDGSGNVTGTPAAAESGEITVADSASPANTATVAVSIT